MTTDGPLPFDAETPPSEASPLDDSAAVTARHERLDGLLGARGEIARALVAGEYGRYEDRPQQRAMARAVSDALAGQEHALIEAGTGVGKTFGYLVPLMLWALNEGRRVAVATSTIALQEQIVLKDLPFLIECLGLDVKTSLVKGRSNYLCLRRMYRAAEQPQALFETRTALDQLPAVIAWGKSTTEGTKQDLPFRPHPAVWEAVCAERGNCLGKKCGHYDVCHYQAGRRAMREASLLIVNHHVLMADLAMRQRGAAFLPQVDAIVIDEAHDLDNIASEHLGAKLTSRGMHYHLGRLWSTRRKTGLLARAGSEELKGEVASLSQDIGAYFEVAIDTVEQTQNGQLDLRRGAQTLDDSCRIPDHLSASFRGLSKRMAKAADQTTDLATSLEIKARAEALRDLAGNVERLSAPVGENTIRWIEATSRGLPALCTAPIKVGPLLKELLWDSFPTVVLTSATLTVGTPPSFAYVREQLGVPKARELSVGSPFDYRSQVQLVLRGDLPSPAQSARAYAEALPDAVLESVRRSDGDALVLFTSIASMNKTVEVIRDDLEADGLCVLVQGEDMDRRALLERLRRGGAVLFGVASFWQGVDVPGEALRHVIITRLPFPVPTHPLHLARSKQVEAAGKSSFGELSLPAAILRLKQGFGRLIRTATDTGRVTILDSRIVTKRYGGQFVSSLPVCDIERIGPA